MMISQKKNPSQIRRSLEKANVFADSKVVVKNPTYRITDLPIMDEHGETVKTISTTVLNPNQSTRGHSHDNQDEMYIFLNTPEKGVIMQVGEEQVPVKSGDVVYVPPGAFHRVFNNSQEKVAFWAIFDNKPKRPEFTSYESATAQLH